MGLIRLRTSKQLSKHSTIDVLKNLNILFVQFIPFWRIFMVICESEQCITLIVIFAESRFLDEIEINI